MPRRVKENRGQGRKYHTRGFSSIPSERVRSVRLERPRVTGPPKQCGDMSNHPVFVTRHEMALPISRSPLEALRTKRSGPSERFFVEYVTVCCQAIRRGTNRHRVSAYQQTKHPISRGGLTGNGCHAQSTRRVRLQKLSTSSTARLWRGPGQASKPQSYPHLFHNL